MKTVKAPVTVRNRRANQPAPKGKSTAQLVRAANRWRDHYNPLRGLVIARIVQLLEAGERGEYADLQWLYRFVEKRFPVLRAAIKRRSASQDKLDWDIKTVSLLPEGYTLAQAEAQQKHLRSRYELIENLRDALRFLALGEFRGFAHLQKHRFTEGPNDGAVRELHWLPQWNFVRDGLFGDWYYNEKATSGATAQSLGSKNRIWRDDEPAAPEGALREGDFIIRVVDMPINEIAVIAAANIGMAKKDYAAFIEIFGLPGCIIEMPPSIPSGKEDEYRDSAEQVAEGASGAVPNGAKPHFPGASIRGTAPFKEFIDAEKEDVVIAATGGKLTMLNEATGLGGSQGEVHDDAFDDLAQAEARELSEIMQRQFDLPELQQQFPGQPVLAYFELAAQDKEDADALVTRTVSLDGIGFRADVAEISEKTGIKLTDDGRPAMAAPMPGFGAPAVRPDKTLPVPEQKLPAKRPEEADKNEDGEELLKNRNSGSLAAVLLAGATVKDLAPFTQRLGRILDIDDDELRTAKLTEFLADADRLKRDILADPQSARVLEGLIAQALAEGISQPTPA